jgi:hypothetical protein
MCMKEIQSRGKRCRPVHEGARQMQIDGRRPRQLSVFGITRWVGTYSGNLESILCYHQLKKLLSWVLTFYPKEFRINRRVFERVFEPHLKSTSKIWVCPEDDNYLRESSIF